MLVVFDLNPAAVAVCTKLGVAAGASAAQVGAEADVVFTSLPIPGNAEEVAAVIAANAKPGSVYIDLSTNSRATARRVHALMSERSIQMLEAPVFGGVPHATDGTIVIRDADATGPSLGRSRRPSWSRLARLPTSFLPRDSKDVDGQAWP